MNLLQAKTSPRKSARRRLGVWMIIAALALAGCETPARRLAPQAVQMIKPGVTTRQEVLDLFGPPREMTSGNGRVLLFYERDYSAWVNRFGPTEPASFVGLSVLCDANNRVLRTHYSLHQVDVTWSPGSVSAGSVVSDQALARIQLNVTTRKEAVAWLGEPTMEKLALNGNLLLQWNYWASNFTGGRRFRVFYIAFNDADVAVASKSDELPAGRR